MRFAEQIAVVTGSSDGIGLATAQRLAAEGAAVILNGRHPERLERTANEIAGYGGRVASVVGDLTASGTVDAILALVRDRFGRIDVLVNNVGGGSPLRELETITNEDWQATLRLNLSSSFELSRAMVPMMKSRGYGRIVNVSSVAGRHKGRLSGPQYSAAKAGMLGLTRHLAWDLARFGISVNAIAPGFVATERALAKWRERCEEERREMLSQVPMGRFAEPHEIAAAVAFLASPEASYITGITLDVNGGSFMS